MKINQLKERVQTLNTDLAVKESELKKIMESLKENGIKTIEEAKKTIGVLQKELTQLEKERQQYIDEAVEIIGEIE